MPRKKKTEVQVTCFDLEAEKKARVKPVDYGTGYARINNMLQAGFTLNEIMEEKKK